MMLQASVLKYDENDNLQPYAQEPVTFMVEGDLELIGPNVITMKGGMGGCYVKTTAKIGSGALTMKAQGMESVTIPFTIGKQ